MMLHSNSCAIPSNEHNCRQYNNCDQFCFDVFPHYNNTYPPTVEQSFFQLPPSSIIQEQPAFDDWFGSVLEQPQFTGIDYELNTTLNDTPLSPSSSSEDDNTPNTPPRYPQQHLQILTPQHITVSGVSKVQPPCLENHTTPLHHKQHKPRTTKNSKRREEEEYKQEEEEDVADEEFDEDDEEEDQTFSICHGKHNKRASEKSPKNCSAVPSASAVSSGEQVECCITGCTNAVTNRLRFSLRCHKGDEFKPDFLACGWNKVCHYHYFSDLYKYKKTLAKNGDGKKSTNTKKSSKKGAQKRKREDESMVDAAYDLNNGQLQMAPADAADLKKSEKGRNMRNAKRKRGESADEL